MLFSIVIPTYNRAKLLKDLLESLERLQIPENVELEILVVDNNSTDCTQKMVEEFIKRKSLPLHYFFEKEQGVSHARNRGIKESRGDIVAFLDDDEIVDERWLSAMCEGFERFPCIAIGGKVIAKWTFPPPDWYTTEGPFRIVGPTSGHNLGDAYINYSLTTGFPISGNLAARRDCFQRHGYFRTDMGPVGNHFMVGEDREFGLRLIHAGEGVLYSPKAIVYNVVHRERVTKEYCRRYHFRFGRVQAMLHEQGESGKPYWVVPRYLFREYFETLIYWIRAMIWREKRTRFYYRLKLNRISGQIFQHLLLWRFEKSDSQRREVVR